MDRMSTFHRAKARARCVESDIQYARTQIDLALTYTDPQADEALRQLLALVEKTLMTALSDCERLLDVIYERNEDE
jgi:hypothetical protein